MLTAAGGGDQSRDEAQETNHADHALVAGREATALLMGVVCAGTMSEVVDVDGEVRGSP